MKVMVNVAMSTCKSKDKCESFLEKYNVNVFVIESRCKSFKCGSFGLKMSMDRWS